MSGFTKSVSTARPRPASREDLPVGTDLERRARLRFPRFRIGDVALALIWFTQGSISAGRSMRLAASGDMLAAFHVATVATILFISGALFLLRGEALGRSAGVVPKLTALVGTWSIIALTALPLSVRAGWLLTAVTTGLILAYAVVGWALLTLRRNLSIFAEARELVRSGPYALVRHPLYAMHIACYVLILLPRISLPALLIASAGIAAEISRARTEEIVLGAAFPEYAAYAASTPPFLPHPRLRRVPGPSIAGQPTAPPVR